jgi:hypothetical protein
LSISFRFTYQNKFIFNAILATYQSHLTFDMIVTGVVLSQYTEQEGNTKKTHTTHTTTAPRPPPPPPTPTPVFTFGVDVNFVAPLPFRWPDILHHPPAFAVLSPPSTLFSSILNLCFSLRVRADGSQTYEQLNNGFL